MTPQLLSTHSSLKRFFGCRSLPMWLTSLSYCKNTKIQMYIPGYLHHRIYWAICRRQSLRVQHCHRGVPESLLWPALTDELLCQWLAILWYNCVTVAKRSNRLIVCTLMALSSLARTRKAQLWLEVRACLKCCYCILCWVPWNEHDNNVKFYVPILCPSAGNFRTVKRFLRIYIYGLALGNPLSRKIACL